MLPSYKRVDTCAAEFEAETPYMYSSYDGASEAAPSSSKKVLILGGGPNRIGQGIEFDYCCCHASFSLRSASCPARPSALDSLCIVLKGNISRSTMCSTIRKDRHKWEGMLVVRYKIGS